MDYRRKIYAIRDLPTIPIIAQKILALVDEDGAAADKLARIIESDQAWTVRILSLANSAYYGRRAQVGTVKQAVVVIGWIMLKQVSLSVLISRTMGSGGNRIAVWRHSLVAAHSASMIAARCRGANKEVAFMGGLLHDVGKLVLDTTLPAEYARVQRIADKENCSLVDAERSVFETDHAEVGAWMAERWQFPADLIAAIGSHHTAEAPTGPYAPLIASVYAANLMAKAADARAKAPEIPVLLDLPEGIELALGIPVTTLNSMVEELEQKTKQIERLLV